MVYFTLKIVAFNRIKNAYLSLHVQHTGENTNIFYILVMYKQVEICDEDQKTKTSSFYTFN